MAAPQDETKVEKNPTSHSDNNEDTSRHVHFTEEDIKRVEGKKEHKDYHSADTHKPEPLHVNFRETDIKRKEGKGHRDYPKTHYNNTNGYEPHNGSWETSLNGSTKVKVSKEDFLLHLKMGATLMILFFGGTFYSSLGRDDEAEAAARKKKKSIQEKIHEQEQKELELIDPPYPVLNEQLIRLTDAVDDHAYTLNADCNFFLADSSISGLGVFTTKSFEEGEIVFPSMNVLSGTDQSPDFEGTNGIELPFHAHLVLLKQHHIYGNVIQSSSSQGGDGSITSKRSIRAGEELFVNFQDFNEKYRDIYHNQLHIHDPTLEEYQKADEIISEAMAAIPTKVVYEGGMSKVKKYKHSGSRNKSRKKKLVPSVDAASILNLLQNTIARYDGRLATLIPETTVEARSILEGEGGTAGFISHRRSVDWIRSNGLCLDGLHPGLSTSNERKAIASRDISAGDIVTTVPVYAMEKDDSLYDSANDCFEAPLDGILLCPLSFASSIQLGTDEGICIGDDENGDCPSNNPTANAKVQWSEYNVLNRRLKHLNTHEFLQQPLTGMTLDVVATQPIAKGDEVILFRRIDNNIV